MDRNSLIGLLLIGLILLVFTFVNKPEREALEQQRLEAEMQKAAGKAPEAVQPEVIVPNDSAIIAAEKARIGSLADALTGTDTTYTIENDLLIADVSSKGGYIKSIRLKEYKTWEGNELHMFLPDSSRFNVLLPGPSGNISTENLYFSPVDAGHVHVSGNDSVQISFDAAAGTGQAIRITYTIRGNSYLIDQNISFPGMHDLLRLGNSVAVEWDLLIPRQEKNLDNERINSTVYYQQADAEVDHIGPSPSETYNTTQKLKWIGLKQQFFTSTVISPSAEFESSAVLACRNAENDSLNKHLSARFTAPLANTPTKDLTLKYYFGPTHYKTLKAVGYDLQKQIPLGWGIFGWVNKFIVIPVFNTFGAYNLNYGIVILLLTLVIKVILFPFQFRSYLSQAKMRVLKPEIDELNAKYENEDPLKKQQAVMELYKKAGVNPLGGCVPLLLQMPILFAMFSFFPSAIELRQQSFLWAEDLSTYDSIINLPFKIWGYGDHVSLFALLMTISTIIYTRMNNQLSGANNQMMPGMMWMMYLMPVIFLFVLNSYPAGLNYYYFLANIITFGQQFAFRKFVDDDKIHAKIQMYKNKPKTVKVSAFQKKLEEMAKKRGMTPPGKN